MKLQDYFDQMATDGSWSTSLYKGTPTYKTYNFIARRAAVISLLENEGEFGRILDVGCGTGDFQRVAKDHKGEYFGIDYSHGMIAHAREEFGQDGERNNFLVGSGEHLPYADNSFDLILALGYIEYFHDPHPSLSEMQRVLKPGGTLLIQSFKKELFTRIADAIKGNNMPEHLPSEWVDKKYSQKELDAMVTGYDFRRSDFVFNNFYMFPGRLRSRFSKAYMSMSNSMGSKLNSSFWGFLAVNYIAKYVLAEES